MKKLLLVVSVCIAMFVVAVVPRVAVAAELGDIGFDDIFDSFLSVDIKVNGSDGPITVASRSRIVVSWISEGASRCRGNWTKNDVRLSGTVAGRITKSAVIKVACIDREGNRDDDAVVVNVSGGVIIPNPVPMPIPTPTPTPTSEGQLKVSLDGNSPTFRLITAGSVDVPITVLRLSAIGESVTLKSIALQLSDKSGLAQNVSKVTIWDGSQKLGEGFFILQQRTAIVGVTNGEFIVQKDDYKSLTIKADIAPQGVSAPGEPGAYIAVDFDGDSSNTRAIGRSSGKNVLAQGGDTVSAGIRVYKSVPTVKYIPLPSGTSLTSASDKPLYRFSVSASPSGNGIGIQKLAFRLTTSSANAITGMLNNINVRAYSDSSFSSIITTGIQTDGTFQAVDKLSAGIQSNAGADVEIYAETAAGVPTTLQIPAGGTRYFEVIGDVNLTGAGTNYSVTTQLQGDSRSNAGMTPSGNFVWSPNSITTVTDRFANDYANGYGVSGLPTSNLTPQILSDRPL